MRYLFFVFILVVSVSCNLDDRAKLRGSIKNYNGALVRIAIRDSLQRDTLRVNNEGKFEYTPRINRNNLIYELSVKGYAQNIPVYLAKGDCVEIELSLQPEQKIQMMFFGDRVNENKYLATLYEIENIHEWYAPEIALLSFRDFKAKVDKKDLELQLLGRKIQNKKIKQQLERQAYLSLQNCRLSWYWFNDQGKHEQKEPVDSNFVNFLKSIDLNDSERCDEKLMENVLGRYTSREINQNLNDYLKRRLEILGQLVTNQEVKDRYLTYIFKKYLRYDLVDLQEVFDLYSALCSDKSLKEEMTGKYREYVRVNECLMKGRVAPDFEFVGIEGEKYHLSDFKGKLLLVDFWATWCAPCREELPYMALLQKHFFGNDRIEIISVAMDNNMQMWKKFLEKEKPTWKQYIVDKKNNDFLEKKYRIKGIPHFMLLDPEGRFIDYSFFRPSATKCLELLEKYLKEFDTED